METQDILGLINHIQVEAVFLFIKILIAFILYLIIKAYVQRFVGYITFKTNPYVSIDRKVNINGIDGIITKISISLIVIETDNGHMLLDTSRWKWQTWIFQKEKV